MHDRRTHRIFADIAALRMAERAAAHQELGFARSREEEAEAALGRADARTAVATQAWDAHVASSEFAPEMARALAGELVRHGEASAAARTHRERMAEAHAEAERAWHDGDARCRVADGALANSRRAIRRDRDERMLTAQADRVATNWRRA